MSLAGASTERKISVASQKSLRHLHRAQEIFNSEVQRFLDEGFSGKVLLELFFVDGHLEQPGKVGHSITCKA